MNPCVCPLYDLDLSAVRGERERVCVYVIGCLATDSTVILGGELENLSRCSRRSETAGHFPPPDRVLVSFAFAGDIKKRERGIHDRHETICPNARQRARITKKMTTKKTSKNRI